MKPWDARIAYSVVTPLRDTFITPNHLTTLRLFSRLLAGAFLSVGVIFYIRNEIENRMGKNDACQPHKGGFEVEDVLYILPVITLFQLENYFLLLATLGAPVFALWVMKNYLSLKIQSL